jgi:hypothetical protein
MRDMSEHWAKDAVNRLILKGIVSGIPIGTGEFKYNPEGYITRGEFAKLLATAKGFEISEATTELKNAFADWGKVPLWARPYISYCYDNGWLDGSQMPDGKHIKHDQAITRAEAAALLGRTLSVSA